MSFSWNAFGWINASLDATVLLTAALCAHAGVVLRLRAGFPSAPSWEAVRVLRITTIIAIVPWALAAVLLGGIIGLSLLARALWCLATVWLPLIGLFLLWRWRRPWLILLVLFPLALKYYGEVWEPNRLEVFRVQIPVAGLKDPVRIVHLSDLQTDGIGAMQLRARAAANGFDPDLVVFTGDVLNHPSLIPEVRGYLAGFKHRGGAFFVSGNVDGPLLDGPFWKAAGFEVLDGRARLVRVGKATLGVLGLGIDDGWNARLLARLVKETESADARVLLSHAPDTMAIARAAPVAVLFSGHTHGGQVCLPWLGPIVTLSRAPRRIAAGGLHRVGGLSVLVSRGLGGEGHIGPRVRTFCRPQIILVELVPA